MPRVYETPTLDAIVALLQVREREDGEKAAMSFADIADASELGLAAVKTSIYNNREKDPGKGRRIYVAQWLRSEGRESGTRGGPFIPLFLAGDKKDARKPKPLTSNERRKNYMARHATVVKLREERRRDGPASPWDAAIKQLSTPTNETLRPAKRGRPPGPTNRT